MSSEDLRIVLTVFIIFVSFWMLTLNSSLFRIAACLKWYIDYIRDPERAKRNPPEW